MQTIAVIPLFIGPLQVLLAFLPAILVGIGTALVALFKPSSLLMLVKLAWRSKWTLLLIGGLAYGGWVGVRELSGPSGEVGEMDAGDWPLARGDRVRTGWVTGSPSPDAAGIHWNYAHEAANIYSSPALAGNRIYFTTADIGVFKDEGRIVCLDADTGALVWTRTPKGYRATFSSPVVQGKYLVVGEGLHLTKDARIVCLDLENDGRVLWTFRTQSHVESTPVIADDRLVVGAGTDGYYCFRLEPDENGEPVMLWHLEGGRYPDAETSPVVADGKVYFGLGIEGHALVCVDLETGEELWRRGTGAPVFTAPSIRDGRVYFGMGHANMIETAEVVIEKKRAALRGEGLSEEEVRARTADMSVKGEVWCVDAATGEVLWTHATDRTVLNAVVPAEDKVYVACRGGTVYELNLDGSVSRTWEARQPIIASPALTDRHLFIATDGGRVYSLDLERFEPEWEMDLGVATGLVSSPVVGRGHVYLGTPGQGMFAIGRVKDGSPEVAWPSAGGGPGVGGWKDRSPLPERGSLLWRFPASADPMPLIAAAPAAADGALFVGMADGGRIGLLRLDPGEGATAPPEESWFLETPNGVRLSPAVHAETVFVVDGAEGDAGRTLRAVDAATGKTHWWRAVAPDATGVFRIDADTVWIQDRAGELARIPRANPETDLWRIDTGPLAGAPEIRNDIALLTLREPARIRAVDAGTGSTLWERPLPGEPVGSPVLDGGTAMVSTDQGLRALRLVDGSEQWVSEPVALTTEPVLREGRVAAVSAAGELLVWRSADGALEHRWGDAVPGMNPLLDRDAVVAATGEGMTRFEFGSGAGTRWMSTGWLGPRSSPMIVTESGVVFATGRYGLVRLGRRR